jgi:site-specific DNA recombinase
VVNGPNLLTGLAIWASCGAGMTRTATRRRDRTYAYYSCAGCQQKGKSVCKGRHIPQSKLDELVVDNVQNALLTPERLGSLLEALLERRALRDRAVAERCRALEAELAQKRDKLARLYRAIEDGIVNLDLDLKSRIRALKNERDLATAALERIAAQTCARPGLTPERIESFPTLMREKLANGDVQARKDYLRSLIARVEVDDRTVRIIGEEAKLADVIAGRQTKQADVRGFVRKWRTRRDSNSRPLPSEGSALSS